MSARARRALAAACLCLALLACAAVLWRHRLPAAFGDAAPVPRTPERRSAATAPLLPQGEVDVNTANAQALTALYGVGPKTAAAIVAERARHGAFRYPEDLLAVPGIGEKTLARFFPQLDFSAQADAMP